jgi:hypothetical protein
MGTTDTILKDFELQTANCKLKTACPPERLATLAGKLERHEPCSIGVPRRIEI